MADHIKERLENPTLPFLRETAELQLRRAQVTLSPEWTRHPPTDTENGRRAPPEGRPRRAARG